MDEPPNREAALLYAALELPPAERAAYLDRACEGEEHNHAVIALRLADEGPGQSENVAAWKSQLTVPSKADK